jgi:hypothetical protein
MYEYHALSVSLSLLLDLCRYRPCCCWCRGSAKHREILSADNHEAILGEAACHRHCHVDVCTHARTQTRLRIRGFSNLMWAFRRGHKGKRTKTERQKSNRHVACCMLSKTHSYRGRRQAQKVAAVGSSPRLSEGALRCSRLVWRGSGNKPHTNQRTNERTNEQTAKETGVSGVMYNCRSSLASYLGNQLFVSFQSRGSF